MTTPDNTDTEPKKATKKKPAAKKPAKPAADKKAPKPEKKKPTVISERIMVKHTFTDAELADLGKQVGRLQGERQSLTEDLAAMSKDYKSRIELKATNISAISVKLANEYEMREATAHVLFDTKARTKRFVNPKDHKEIYKEEPMTDSDWQLPMFRPDELAATKAKKPAEPKSEGASGDEAQLPELSAELKEAASAFDRAELDLDTAISEGMIPKTLVSNFRKFAKKAKWEAKIINGIAQHALSREDRGISEVADTLRPFCILK